MRCFWFGAFTGNGGILDTVRKNKFYISFSRIFLYVITSLQQKVIPTGKQLILKQQDQCFLWSWHNRDWSSRVFLTAYVRWVEYSIASDAQYISGSIEVFAQDAYLPPTHMRTDLEILCEDCSSLHQRLPFSSHWGVPKSCPVIMKMYTYFLTSE